MFALFAHHQNEAPVRADLQAFFGTEMTLLAAWGGRTARIMLDAQTEDIMGGRVQSDEYQAMLPTGSFAGIDRGDELQIDGATYRVREVRLLDDGALKELLLTRASGPKPSTFAFEDDLSAFFDCDLFATTGTWGALSARVILDQPTDDILSGRVLSDSYQVTLRTEDWPGITRGAVVAIDGVSYVAREAPRLMGDGALKQMTMRRQ